MPATTAANPCDELAESAERDGPYVFLPHALRHLATKPGDHRIRLLAFKHLLAMGLIGPAIELLDERPDLVDEAPEVAAVREQIDGLPRDPLPWSQFRSRFEANLTVLLEQCPDLRERRDEIETAVDDLDLYQCSDGNYQLSLRDGCRLKRWLPDLIDNRNAIDPDELKPSDDEQVPPPYLINHLRFGDVLRCAYGATTQTFLGLRPALHVIEPNLAALAVCLHTADLRDVLGDERVHIWAGHDSALRFVAYFEERQDLTPPTRIITQPTWSRELAPADAATVALNDRARRGAIALRDIEHIYEGRDRAWWANRFATAGPQDPLRIWGVATRATNVLRHSMRDAARACEALGHRFRMLIESDEDGLMPQAYVLQSIVDFQPDLILSLDHLRYEYENLRVKNIPFCCWLQDPMPNLLCPEAGRSIGELDLPFGYFFLPCTERYGFPKDRFLPAVIPVSTHVFHDTALTDEERERYACDICYASNASTSLEAFKASWIAARSSHEHPLLEHVYSGAMSALAKEGYEWPQDVAVRLVRDAMAATGIILDEETEQLVTAYFAFRLLDWGLRQRTLEWVGAWARRTGRVFRLYGNGWENHPTLAPFAAGVLDHGEPLRAAYRGATLGLQLNGFRHQRTFEMVASGCLPLARYLPGDFDNMPIEAFARRRDAGESTEGDASYFPRLERVVFRTPQEFEAMADGFLADREHHGHVYGEIREVVLRDYKYEVVMAEVIEAMREKLIHPDRPVWVEPDAWRARRLARDESGAVTCLSPRPPTARAKKGVATT